MTSETEEKARSAGDIKQTMSGAAEKLQVIAKPLFDLITFLIPFLIKYGRMAKNLYMKLPQNMINFFLGFVFCFFGGLYPVLFAAIQAAEFGGRKKVTEAIKDLADEAIKIIDESKKDDTVDEDNDGVADVNQIAGKEYVTRKTKLVLRKMTPDKVDKALNSIYSVWLAVAAVLTIEFARAISLALSIADFMKQPVDRFVAPTIQIAVPDDYDKWVPVILGWICKSIGMSIAWYIQAVRSAFASALTGGLMMSRATYNALLYRDIKLGGLIKDDHGETSLDEWLSYLFAGLGFYFQLRLGFKVPFPFNLFLWPFEVFEYLIRWSITNAASVPK